ESVPVLFRLPRVDGYPQAVVDEAPLLVATDVGDGERAASEASVAQPPQILPEVVAKPVTAQSAEAPAHVHALAPHAVARTAPDRSWGENWSIGVVRILLVIGLVTASIIAFTYPQAIDPDLLADGKEELHSAARDELIIPELHPALSSVTPA